MSQILRGLTMTTKKVSSIDSSGTGCAFLRSSPEVAIRHITLWRNGFQIGEDGELRGYDDPQNAQLLEQINNGCVLSCSCSLAPPLTD